MKRLQVWIIVIAATLVWASASGCRQTRSTHQPSVSDSAVQYIMETPYGNITLELFDDTPLHKANFIKLVGEGYYENTAFHRVVPGILIQCGDPNTRDRKMRELHGRGGPDYTIPNEAWHAHMRGVIGAARFGDKKNPKRESSGSQFFINLVHNYYYDSSYTAFGKVISGIEVADKISNVPRDALENPMEAITISIYPVD